MLYDGLGIFAREASGNRSSRLNASRLGCTDSWLAFFLTVIHIAWWLVKSFSKICLKNYDMLYDGLGIFAREASGNRFSCLNASRPDAKILGWPFF